MQFIITGRVVPYVRMTRRGKFVNKRAQLYLASKDAISYQLKEQMMANDWQQIPGPLRVSLNFTIAGSIRRGDLDNLIKGVIDSANGIVYPDDRYIDRIIAAKQPGDEDTTIFVVESLR